MFSIYFLILHDGFTPLALILESDPHLEDFEGADRMNG
jgi:hypothetical protein